MKKDGYYFLKTKVHSYQLDRDKQISPVAIAELMQEAAGMHSNTGGFGYKQVISKSLVWVLNALRFEVDKYPIWDDEITIKTWIVDSNRFLSRRDFQFINSNGDVIITGSTIWILYNFETKRPQNIQAMGFDVVERNGEFAVKETIKTSREKVEGDIIDEFSVKYSDLDMVGHLNNTRYIRAIVDSYSIAHFEKHSLNTFEIQFRTEAVYGEDLRIFEEKHDELHSKLEIKRGDDKSVCFVKLEWNRM